MSDFRLSPNRPSSDTSHRTAGNTDEDQLASVEKRIRNLEQAFASLQKHVRTRISEAQQERNTLVPIHRLPSQLLLRTFTLALSGTPVGYYYDAMSKIGQVSKVFHTLIDNSPSMWSFISTLLPKRLNEKALRKSKNSPLTIEASYCRDPAARKLVDSVLNQAFRFRSLDLVVDPDLLKIPGLVQPSPPVLECLTLRERSTMTRQHATLHLFGGRIPRLRELALDGVMLEMDWKGLSNLVSLEITNQYAGAPSLSQLLEIVTSNPLLETLTLQKIHFPPTDTLPPKGRWELPRLTQLCVDLSTTATTTLLNRLAVPNCTQLRIHRSSSFRAIDSEEYFEGSLEQFSPLLRSTERTSKSDLEMQLGLNRTGVSFDLGGVDIQLWVADPYKVLEWIALTLNGDRITRKCTLQLHSDLDLSDERLHTWLDKFPCVTKLQLNGLRHTNEFLKYLSQPVTVRSTLRWPLPKLAQLSIESGDANPKIILNMVRARYGKTGQAPKPKKSKEKGKGIKMPNLPIPLTFFDMGSTKGFNQGVYDELSRIVGDAVFIWEDSDEPSEDEFNEAEYAVMGYSKPHYNDDYLSWW